MSEHPWKSPAPVQSWSDRANTIGYISGGMAVQAFLLRQVLDQLPASGDVTLQIQSPDGEDIRMQCEKLAVHQLSSSKLVIKKEDGTWAPSVEASKWRKIEDDFYLASHLHANVKFFGEALAAIESNTGHADLTRVAREIYGMQWKSSDQVRRRVGWLRSLGFVELWGQRIVLTEKGQVLLNGLDLCPPEIARGETQSEASQEKLDFGIVEEFDLTQDELRKRKVLIGYIPRGKNAAEGAREDASLTPIAALREIARIVRDYPLKDELQEASKEALGISQGSFSSMMHAARHMGMIEQVALNRFSVSSTFLSLLSPGDEAALAKYLHSKYAFFGEILEHLDKPKATSSLVAIGKQLYGIGQLTNSEVRLRLNFLEDAGLVFRLDWQRFARSSLGEDFLNKITLQQKAKANEVQSKEESSGGPELGLTELANKLTKYANSGTESLEFEKQVAEAFRVLGFHVEHIGGSGNTDVLATAKLAPSDRYKIIIDAKSSGSGSVSESNVKFDALKDHKRKNKADFIVVVGPGFAARVKEWAVNHGVALLEVSDLIDVVKMHSTDPLSLVEFKDVLGRSDLHTEEIRERYNGLKQRSALIAKVLDLAFQEANDEDPLSGGSISEENISYVLRKEMTPRPSVENVREALEFLCSPMVAALEENRSKYKVVDSPWNVITRLKGLGISIGYALAEK